MTEKKDTRIGNKISRNMGIAQGRPESEKLQIDK